jgi:hypothetical protein
MLSSALTAQSTKYLRSSVLTAIVQGGNLELKAAHAGLTIVGPRADRDRIPGIDVALGDGDTWALGPHEVGREDRTSRLLLLICAGVESLV